MNTVTFTKGWTKHSQNNKSADNGGLTEIN